MDSKSSCVGTKKLSKKAVSILLMLSLILSSLAFSVGVGTMTQALTDGQWREYINIEWYDEALDHYIIEDAEGLAGLAHLVNNRVSNFEDKTIELSTDIDLDDHYWVPIGIREGTPFKGKFDAQNHEIKNMKIGTDRNNPAKYSYIGLFGRVVNGNIENLKIGKGSHIYAAGFYVGGIAGCFSGTTINNCSNYGDIFAINSAAGGIVGNLRDTNVFNCSNLGKISVLAEEPVYVGGIAGNSESGNIANCANYNEISAEGGDNTDAKVGGIVGLTGSTAISNCINTGEIFSNTHWAFPGGIAGWVDNGDLSDNYYLQDAARIGITNWDENIDLQVGNLSKEEMIDLVNSLNNFVNRNPGEGFLGWTQSNSVNNGYPYLININ